MIPGIRLAFSELGKTKPRQFPAGACDSSGRVRLSLSAAPATCMSGLAARPRFAGERVSTLCLCGVYCTRLKMFCNSRIG